MPKNRYTAEEIIHRLREADVLIAEGKTVTATCKQLGVTDQTYYRWRKEYGRHEGRSGKAPEGAGRGDCAA